MITNFDPHIIDLVVERMVRDVHYVSLHYELPDFALPAATELVFGSYARQTVIWTPVRNGVVLSTEKLIWAGLEPPVTIAAIGLNETLNGGELIAYGLLADPVSSGSTTWEIPAGSIAVRAG